MRTPQILLGFVFALLAAWLLWGQIGPRVLAEKEAESGEGRVLVREIQLRPFSLTGLLRANERFYRCEYYPHKGWPMFSAQTFGADSYIARKVEIEWRNDSTAEVVIDDAIAFECAEARWRQVPLKK